MGDAETPTGTRGIHPAHDPLPPTEGAPNEPAPVVVDTPVGVENVPLTVLAVIAAILLLQYASVIFIPIVIALLVSYALGPSVTALHKRGVPTPVGSAIMLVLALTALGIGTYTLAGQVGQIIDDVPAAAQRIRARMREHQAEHDGVVGKVQRAAKEVEKTANEATPGGSGQPGGSVPQVQVVQSNFSLSNYVWSGSMTVLNALGQFVLIVFLVYFFLNTGDLYKRKLVKIAGPTFTQKKLTVQILDEINCQIESFMKVQVLTSAVVAIATAGALWWLGLNEYIIWGLMAGIFNSIPYLGPVIVTGGLGVVGFMQFDSIPKTITICAVAFVITSLEGFLLTPALMSRAARINSAAIFTGLLFWSWIWGVWGTILAVPMLMMLKAVCDHIEDLQPIGELLGE
jgi:predicted PurR-regulated permease PerM